ncbi:hypothetical protein ACFO9Q_10185 [Paenibacillus sp. GCM10023252]|uniref:hypothetical protein n=1 Tax=Paenibacillus sp. GCM10023252 TaxID=3252649 RepID=UPI00361B40D4
MLNKTPEVGDVMVIIHHNRILKILNNGLLYLDENSSETFIDFEVCRRNWITYINKSEDFEITELTEEETKTIGWRDAFNKPIYIEFFSEPRTRFIYPYRRNLYEWIRNRHGMKAYKFFRKTCISIEENGWTTFDLG